MYTIVTVINIKPFDVENCKKKKKKNEQIHCVTMCNAAHYSEAIILL